MRDIRITRFDLTVWAVALSLLAATALLAYANRPESVGVNVAYLYPSDGREQQVWMVPVDDPDAARQITNSETSVYDFGVSPDGRYLVFSQRDAETNLNELYLLNVVGGQVRQLTNCVAEDADCRSPVWRGEGDLVAFERMTANSALEQVGPGALRIWLVDVSQNPPQTGPLSTNTQIIGYAPQWAADGDSIAFYSADVANPGTMVFDFLPAADEERALKFIPNSHGTVGALSPDGERLVYPELVFDEATEGLVTHLKMADLDTLESVDLTSPDDPVDDTAARWHPNGRDVVIQRRYTDERYTRGYQLYLLNTETGEISDLIYDERYSHGFYDFNADGSQLVLQRFALLDNSGNPAPGALPEIWVYDMASGEMTLVAENAFYPRWLEPGQ